MAAKTRYVGGDRNVRHTPGSALTGGDLILLNDGRAAHVPVDIAANVEGEVYVNGVVEVPKASGTVFAVGERVYWDASAGLAVKPSLALDGSADLCIGRCVEAAASGTTVVLVGLNATPADQTFVYEFDCETGVDSATHILIPAAANPHGLLIDWIIGVVTEQFAGASQDQGIVTVEDTDGTDLATITATDAGADAVGDVLIGYRLQAATSGDAGKTVAAGKGVRGVVTQATSGAGAAGKMKVYVRAVPLV